MSVTPPPWSEGSKLNFPPYRRTRRCKDEGPQVIIHLPWPAQKRMAFSTVVLHNTTNLSLLVFVEKKHIAFVRRDRSRRKIHKIL